MWAIVGTHIRLVEKPHVNIIPTNYRHWHDHHLIILQGVCDVNLLFWDVCERAVGGTPNDFHF